MTKQLLIPLVRRSVAGDLEALEQLLLSQNPLILWLIRRTTDSPEDAKDIHQEVSFRIFQNIATLKSPEAFCTWLNAIVAHECIKHLAGHVHCVSIDEFDEEELFIVETDAHYNPSAHLERLELNSTVEAALESLTEPFRSIIHMRYNRDMCCREIADFTGMNTRAVSVALFRAKEKLRDSLGGRGVFGA